MLLKLYKIFYDSFRGVAGEVFRFHVFECFSLTFPRRLATRSIVLVVLLLIASVGLVNVFSAKRTPSVSNNSLADGKIVVGGAQRCVVPNELDYMRGPGMMRFRILEERESSGWLDPYFRLASHWAPVIRQYVKSDSTYGYRQDYITRFDYDVNWTGNDNWDNFPEYLDALYAYVYYSVIETETHYFIHYMFFHPRDWGRAWFSIVPDEHENDMEGILFVVSKDGSEFGSPLVMVTRAHTDFYQYSADSNVGDGTADDVDGSIVFDGWRPVIYVEAQGHVVYGDEGRVDQYYLYDDVIIYRFNGNLSEHPDYADLTNISYALIPIIKVLWPKALDSSYIGDGKMYDQVFTYSNQRLGISIDVPASFDGDDSTDGAPDKANPPWGMHDSDYDNDGLMQGDWFFDPANFTRTVFSIPYEFSLNYTYNPYVSGEHPEFDYPLIRISSPSSDAFVYEASVNISWRINDSSSLYIVKVIVDGNTIHTDRSKGNNSIIVTLEDGKHSVNITAIDIWGNYRWVYREFYVDTEMPKITIIEPSNKTYMNTSIINIRWNSSDENGISSHNVYVDGNFIAQFDGSTTSYSIQLSEGYHEISVEAVDNAGRVNSSTIYITVDITPPTISILSPQNNTHMIYNDTVYVEWSASDNTDIDHFEVRVDNGTWINVHKNTSICLENLSLYEHTVWIRGVDLAGNIEIAFVVFYLDPSEPKLVNGDEKSEIAIETSSVVYMSWTIEGDYDHFELIVDNYWTINIGRKTYHVFRNLSEGIHNITIRVVYPAGDYIEKTYKVMVDKTPPMIYANEEVFAGPNNDSITLRWNASDKLSGVEHYELWFNGKWIYLGAKTTYEINISGLPDGKYSIIIRAYDNVGNYRQKIIILIIDRQKPTLKILNLINNSYLRTNYVMVVIEINDTTEVKYFDMYLNGTFIARVTNGRSYLIPDLDDGLYELFVVAYDLSNNTVWRKIYFTIDTQPPDLQIISPKDLELINSTAVTVEWTTDNDAIGYYVRIDNEAWIYAGWTSSYTFANVSEGCLLYTSPSPRDRG